MKKKIITAMLFLLLASGASAQRGNKGQHAASLTYGINANADNGWTMGLNYYNYRKAGTMDVSFLYNSYKGKYRNNRADIRNYLLSGGYSQKLLQNYTRTLIMYAGANAAIGYTQGNNGNSQLTSGITLKKTEEISYALVPTFRMDIYVSKNFGFTAQIQDMIFVHSDLMQPHNTTITIGLKYLIK